MCIIFASLAASLVLCLKMLCISSMDWQPQNTFYIYDYTLIPGTAKVSCVSNPHDICHKFCRKFKKPDSFCIESDFFCALDFAGFSCSINAIGVILSGCIPVPVLLPGTHRIISSPSFIPASNKPCGHACDALQGLVL